MVGVESAAVPDTADLDLFAVCRLARSGLSLNRDRNGRGQVVDRVRRHQLEGQTPEITADAARGSVHDQTLETLRRRIR